MARSTGVRGALTCALNSLARIYKSRSVGFLTGITNAAAVTEAILVSHSAVMSWLCPGNGIRNIHHVAVEQDDHLGIVTGGLVLPKP